MQLKTKMVAVALTLAALSGCSEPPKGYLEAPALSAYVQTLVKTTAIGPVETLAVCQPREDQNPPWFVSMLFLDGTFYEYELHVEGTPATLIRKTTKNQRDLQARERDTIDLGCLGYESRVFPSGTVFNYKGAYRVHVGSGSPVGYVPEKIAFNETFRDAEKARLKAAIDAAHEASGALRKTDPPEISWGIKE